MSLLDFRFHTEPDPHQLAEFQVGREQPKRALWWDPGTGKSKPVIDLALDLAQRQILDRVLVLAPKGVHTNWVDHEVPKHAPEGAIRAFAWSTEQSSRKWHQDTVRCFVDQIPYQPTLEHARRFGLTPMFRKKPWLVAMSYDSAMTEAGTKFCQKFLKDWPCLLVVDESHRVKAPNAARTKRVLAMSKHAAWVRVLTGTPCDNSPFDAYSQVKIMDDDAWRDLGCSNFTAFKAHFGIWEQVCYGANPVPKLTSYRNLDQLKAVMERYGARIRLQDVVPVPEPRPSRVYHELTPSQRRVYDGLKEQLFATLDDGSEVTCQLRIVLLTRLRQVAAGYVPDDDERKLRLLADPNPRILALLQAVEDHPGQALIWCVRDKDVDLCLAALRSEYGPKSAVQYDGRTSDSDREAALAAFRGGSATYFVGKPSAGGVGITLTQARTVIYYSSDFSLTDRKQSVARAVRRGQEHNVHVVDIVAERSVDEYVLKKLATKNHVSADLLGDPDVGLI